MRAYYENSVRNFLQENPMTILGQLANKNQFTLEDLQRNTWLVEIDVLKSALTGLDDGHIIFEYTIPRIGNRIDNILIYNGLIFLLEFKVGERNYPRNALNQVTDYALDLKDFHKESQNRILVPILVATEAYSKTHELNMMKDGITEVFLCNHQNIRAVIDLVLDQIGDTPLDPTIWLNSIYKPTPTIIEAAQALYRNHTVTDISRNDASAINLTHTTEAINQIIDESKRNNRKSICFITGVPGAGKTLAGLNIAIERQRADENEHAVFLSGNGPLVDVLQEALARDQRDREGIKKSEAMRKAREFIQIIHHFRDDSITRTEAPIEKVAIFDEAQRAWTEDMLVDFMTRKKGKPNFNMSEPEFLISVMDRHEDWAVIICLVGGGQEINTGEAGLIEWFDSLKAEFPHWTVYVSDQITDSEYSQGVTVPELLSGMNCHVVKDLHLAVSLRSYRSENVASFIKALLDVAREKATVLYQTLNDDYPIFLTRDLQTAKEWVKSMAKGTQRYGITASSGARRLRTHGVWVQSKIDAKNWFLNTADDVRSSFFLEDTATEFDIQGLELDWTIVCWDANFRFNDEEFEYYSFKGTRWMNIRSAKDCIYLKNAYRVLLTRARQGFVIFVPEGEPADATRLPKYYNGIYQYLEELGIKKL